MVTPAVDGVDLFKIAGRSISGWIPSFKTNAGSPVKQPFCSQLEERLLLWLDYHPATSSRVTMDYLMKLVTTALEWTYQTGEHGVKAETLEHAASLLVLRRDTLRIIDGAGPDVEAPPSESPEQGNGSRTEPEQKTVQVNVQQNTTETGGTVGEQVPTFKTPQCTFSGFVSIDLERYLSSSTHLVECPVCGRTRTHSPKSGVLRFPPHDRRKKETPHTEQRWAKGETDWDVVGRERAGST